MYSQAVLIISFTDLRNEPRVRRQLKALVGDYPVTAIGLTNPEIEGVDFVEISYSVSGTLKRLKKAVWLKLRLYQKHYWSVFSFGQAIEKLKHRNFSLIIAHDIETMPFAVKVAKGAKIILDAHEYAPRQFENSWSWKFFRRGYIQHLCFKNIPRADRMITVSEGIAREYRNVFGIEPTVITNMSEYQELRPSPVNEKDLKIVYHGFIGLSRTLSEVAEMMRLVDRRYSLYLMLKVDNRNKFFIRLHKLIRNMANIHLVPPVAMEDIAEETNKYDIGLISYAPINFNMRYMLPNKFFDYLQARLMVLCGPHIEMSKFLDEFKFGKKAEGFSARDLATALDSLTGEEIVRMKENSDKAAGILTAEANMKKLQTLIRELLD
jgi:hypothetical protein